MIVDSEAFVSAYQDGIDLLIDSFGKSIQIVYPTMITAITEEDRMREGESIRPSYTDPAYSETITTETTIALIKFAPKEWLQIAQNVAIPENIIRLKTYLADIEKLSRATHIVLSDSGVNSKYKMIRSPTPFGLGEHRYAVSYWERI